MIRLLNSLFELIYLILKEVIQIGSDICIASISTRRKEEFDADFIPITDVFDKKETGFTYGEYASSPSTSLRNSIVFGGSGSGKSQKILFNSVSRMATTNCSLILNDPAAEGRCGLGSYLEEKGFEVRCLNFNDFKQSEGFNPLLRADSSASIEKISKMLISHSLGENSSQSFWNLSGEQVLSFFIKYLISHAEPVHQNLYNVQFLIKQLMANPSAIDQLIVQTLDPLLLADYKALVATENKVLLNILSTCRAALSIFTSPEISKITCVDTIDFEEFRHKKIALFCNTSIGSMKYHSTIVSLFLEQFFNYLMQDVPANNEKKIYFILDEISSLKLDDSLSITLSNCRKYGVGICLLFQSYSQLIEKANSAYAQSINSNCYVKVYMSGQPISVAQELETTLGKYQYNDGGVMRTRPLLTADEIRQLEEDLIIVGNLPPIKKKLVPFYKTRLYKYTSSLPPFIPQRKIFFDEPPLIALPNIDEERNVR